MAVSAHKGAFTGSKGFERASTNQTWSLDLSAVWLVNRPQQFGNANVRKCHINQSMSWPRSRAALSSGTSSSEAGGEAASATHQEPRCGSHVNRSAPIWTNVKDYCAEPLFLCAPPLRFVSVYYPGGDASLRLINSPFSRTGNYNETCKVTHLVWDHWELGEENQGKNKQTNTYLCLVS